MTFLGPAHHLKAETPFNITAGIVTDELGDDDDVQIYFDVDNNVRLAPGDGFTGRNLGDFDAGNQRSLHPEPLGCAIGFVHTLGIGLAEDDTFIFISWDNLEGSIGALDAAGETATGAIEENLLRDDGMPVSISVLKALGYEGGDAVYTVRAVLTRSPLDDLSMRQPTPNPTDAPAVCEPLPD